MKVRTRHWITNKGIEYARNIQYYNDLMPMIVVSHGKIDDDKLITKALPDFFLPIKENVKVYA